MLGEKGEVHIKSEKEGFGYAVQLIREFTDKILGDVVNTHVVKELKIVVIPIGEETNVD
jgi:hypothetical protein